MTGESGSPSTTIKPLLQYNISIYQVRYNIRVLRVPREFFND
jgi:hypothetical protein